MDPEKSIVKGLLIYFNFACLLAGLVLCFVGTAVLSEATTIFDKFYPGLYHLPAVMLVVLGSIVFVLALFGCCGSAKENRCMLISYAWMLCFIFFVELIIGASTFTYRNDFGKVLQHQLTKAYSEYSLSSEDKVKVDSLQETVQCCGLDSPQYWHNHEKMMPQSCCGNNITTGCSLLNPTMFDQGCVPKLKSIGLRAGNTIGWVAIVVGVIEAFGIILGCTLANSITRLTKGCYGARRLV